jgi:hypothetical protein
VLKTASDWPPLLMGRDSNAVSLHCAFLPSWPQFLFHAELNERSSEYWIGVGVVLKAFVFFCYVFFCSGRTRARRYQQHTSARYRHQHAYYCPGETNTPQLLRQRSKKRSSSLQREELLQIIQANMEKNNLSFQTSRYARLQKSYHSQGFVTRFRGSYLCNIGDFITCGLQNMFPINKVFKLV